MSAIQIVSAIIHRRYKHHRTSRFSSHSNFCRDLRTTNADDESEALDLFVVGQDKLANTRRLAQYKRDFIKKGIIRNDVTEDDMDDEMEEDEPEDGAEEIDHFVSDSESEDVDDSEW